MENKNYCVYKHTSPNGKMYIGMTGQNPEKRWGKGKNYYCNQIFKSVIDKYGWDDIQHEILFDGLTEAEAKQIEIETIFKFKTQNNKFGYNLTAGGDGMSGFKTRESTKLKLSLINKGKRHTEESKKKMSDSRKGEKSHLYGKRPLKETCVKISNTKKGTFVGELNPFYGMKHSKEARVKMSKSHNDVSLSKNPRARVIIMFNKDDEQINEFGTLKEAALFKGCNVSTMRRNCKGIYKDGNGFIWKYKEEV